MIGTPQWATMTDAQVALLLIWAGGWALVGWTVLHRKWRRK